MGFNKLWHNLLPNISTRSLATISESSNEIVRSAGSGGRISSKILKLARNGVEDGSAHFRVGEKQLFFPKARLILLRPNAKHTPYQAKFIVPKSFNKLDLRDYLFHVYGLRAMNITTQLLNGRYTRQDPSRPRIRGPQIKKMTIEMSEPFIWPEEPTPQENEFWTKETFEELSLSHEQSEMLSRGSDIYKKGTSFEGVVGPYKEPAQPFVPKFLKRQMVNQKQSQKLRYSHMQDLLKLERYVNN
ncbi:hypothetical protein Kpol_186p1 [Vanderwaltozyma polyspora DSM 70294]|uniref:Large ribosomal subunit protein uL23m n=1 Tax=Vanderwaltozyma polyspora (strain ATCC 22028 / DSM 70294 / BCRC 21397 / CBS 2163 / NBRC 10782 / NRRL Y-8283 / UCD 57-17) TaxID=436907 RepID=A7TTM6_VANPO|nr:uncharacterized protein Kpol_186p1 [Vanderwaltozyma polyspora DSM 70294]EDO14379.1 hypothetical protein Kpol_186p1 [Vanderwaltozyma polyspora DSM 70294]